jgi:prepilin-type N-terminal cleavage/methylation domain-containing protein
MNRCVIRPQAAAQGFGLVELIVALTLLSVGLLALTGAVAVAQRSFAAAEAVEEGTSVAALVLDSLMSETMPVPGERRRGRMMARWTVHSDSVATVVDLTVHTVAGRDRQMSFRASRQAW